MKLFFSLLITAFTAMATVQSGAQTIAHGSIVTEHILSAHLRDTKTGLDPNRTIKIYLPPGYSASDKRYPVVYYFHSLNWSAEKMFEDGNLVKLLERGFDAKVVKEFILVAADYSTPTLGSWYENSPTTGRWVDFTVQEVVPFIDAHFRTIRDRDSRGLAGDFVGGRGALLFAMLYPDLFSAVYAMHPVATGTGTVPMASRPDWQKIHQAKTIADLAGDGFGPPVVAIHQAFLPNPNRPPFYCDFMVEMENGRTALQVDNAMKLKNAFLLDHRLDANAQNLRKMRGIAFDWARYDPNQDHVYSNQTFTRKLDELGIEHEAEEYRGNPWEKNWTPEGRFYARVLPFFNRNLVFD